MKCSSRNRVLPDRKKSFAFPAIIFAFSILAGSALGRFVLPETGRWLPWTFPAFSLAAVSVPSPLAFAAVGTTAGIILENLRVCHEDQSRSLSGKEVTLEGVVLEVKPARFGKVEMVFDAREVLALEKIPVRTRVLIRVPEEDAPFPGSRVRLRASMDQSPFPGTSRTWRARGDAAQGSLLSVFPRLPFARRGAGRLSSALGSSPPEAAGLLGAISLGQRWRVNDSVRGLFRRTGIYHLMAVSGVHLLSALFPAVLLVRLWTSWRETDRIGSRTLLMMALGAGTLWIYLSLAGFSTSALRAGVFLLLVWFCRFLKRLNDPFSALGWCVTLIVCFGRKQQPDMALLLSAGAVLGILCCLDRRRGAVEGALGATLGAFLFTLPISVWFSGGIPLLSPACNVTVGAVFGAVLIPLAVLTVLAACLTPFSLEPLVQAWCFLTGTVIRGLRLVSSPDSFFLVLSETGCLVAAASGLAALAVWRNRRYGLRSGLALFLGIALLAGAFQQGRDAFLAGKTTVTFPRAGQADGVILRSGGKTILIDTAGPPAPGGSSPVAAALSRMGVRKIDAVFLTHAHPDHIGGFAEIARKWMIGTLYLPGAGEALERWAVPVKSLSSRVQILFLSQGERIQCGDFHFEVLGPPSDWTLERGENEGSLVLHVQAKGLSFLFTGDAPWDVVSEALGRLDSLHLLKIPHHGSRHGFPPSRLEERVLSLKRKGYLVAVFPSPRPGRSSPLPAEEVVDWFERRGIPCFFTGTGNGAAFEAAKGRRGEDSGQSSKPGALRGPLVDIAGPFCY